MVQTITAWSNGSYVINTGNLSTDGNGFTFSAELDQKISDLISAFSALGASEFHAEKDTFREFEHLVSGGDVSPGDFGTTLSASDFDWIMTKIDEEVSAELLAQEQAMQEAAEAEAALRASNS